MTTRIDTSLKLFTLSSSIWLFSRRIPDPHDRLDQR